MWFVLWETISFTVTKLRVHVCWWNCIFCPLLNKIGTYLKINNLCLINRKKTNTGHVWQYENYKRNRLNKVLMWDVNFPLQVRTNSMQIKHKTKVTTYRSKSSLYCVSRTPFALTCLWASVLVSYWSSFLAFLFQSTVRAKIELRVWFRLWSPPSNPATHTHRVLGSISLIAVLWIMAFVAICFQMNSVKMRIVPQKFCNTGLLENFYFLGLLVDLGKFITLASVAPRPVFPAVLDSSPVFLQSFVLGKSQELLVCYYLFLP